MAVIGKIRKHFGWGVTIIVALATLAFIFNDFGKRRSQATEIAKVDGMEVSFSEFESARERNENTYKARTQDGKLTSEQQFQVKAQTYYELVSEKLLNRECEKLGIVVGEEEMNDMFLGTFLSNEVRQLQVNSMHKMFVRLCNNMIKCSLNNKHSGIKFKRMLILKD